MKRILPTIAITLILLTISIAIILYGRGFRPNFTQKTISSKGLLVANSQPNGAQILVNGELSSATNSTLTLDPNWYDIKIVKEGYSSWQKRIRVQGEIVAKIDSILFPINPALSPLTVTGVTNPTVSPNNDKIVFSVSKYGTITSETTGGGGVYLLNISDGPLGINRNIIQIAKSTSLLSFDAAEFIWSPGGKQILAKTVEGRYYLLETEESNDQPLEVTVLTTNIFDEWTKEKVTLEKEQLEALKPELTASLTEVAKIISWSPDETKILYEASISATLPQIINPPLIGTNPTEEQRNISEGKIYVYDIKEDKNFFVMDAPQAEENSSSKEVPTGASDAPLPIRWFPTSSHFLVVEDTKISVMDYDGTNKVTLYAGPFLENLVVPWPNGSKIVILTTLNPQPDQKPNLYAINIR